MAVLAMVSALGVSSVHAAELDPRTAESFDRYARSTEARMAAELDGRAPFLWVDRQPEAQRRDFHARLVRGQVVVGRLESGSRNGASGIPGGLVHHWVGTVLIPGATLERTVQMVQDYDRYATIYSPNVRRSRTISREGPRFKAFTQLFMKKVISVVLNTEYDIEYVALGQRRMHVRSYATRIAEVQEPGTPRETEKPAGQGGGYLWRFNNYCSFEEANAGTFMQCESLSLSRDVPLGLGWLIGPFVTSIPRESLTFTLNAARKFLTS
jgi:hypothetical protein